MLPYTYRISTLIFVILACLLVIGLRKFFGKILFNPRRSHRYVPTRPHANVLIGDKIHAWHFHDFAGRPLIIYCHGTFGNVSYYNLLIDLTQRLRINLLLFDYQGYGKSSGSPSQKMIVSDAHKAYEYALEHHPSSEIIVWGESLGGFPAIDIAMKYDVRGLIVMSSFASLERIPQTPNHHWVLRLLGRSLPIIKLDIPNYQSIAQVKCPVAIVHSVEDKFINFDHAQTLYNHIGHHKRLLIPVKGTHRRPFLTEAHLTRMLLRCDVSIDDGCQDILHRIADETTDQSMRQ